MMNSKIRLFDEPNFILFFPYQKLFDKPISKYLKGLKIYLFK